MKLISISLIFLIAHLVLMTMGSIGLHLVVDNPSGNIVFFVISGATLFSCWFYNSKTKQYFVKKEKLYASLMFSAIHLIFEFGSLFALRGGDAPVESPLIVYGGILAILALHTLVIFLIVYQYERLFIKKPANLD